MQQLGRLGEAPFLPRFLAMTEYMAQYYTRAWDEEAAQMMAAMHTELQSSPKASLLYQHLLEIADAEEDEVDDPLLLNNPADRRDIMRRDFADIETPLARDVGLLDSTEAARAVLQRECSRLPNAWRPRDEQLTALAGKIARIWFDDRLAREAEQEEFALSVDTGLAKEAIEAVLRADLHLHAAPAEALAQSVLRGIERFEAAVCERCPLQCFQRPDEPARETFWSTDHPSGLPFVIVPL